MLLAADRCANLVADMATPSLDEQVRARLRQLRFERGLSVRALGAVAGVSAATVSRLETGERRLTVAHLESLASALGVEPHTLLGTATGALGPPPPGRDGRAWLPIGPERTTGRRVYRIDVPVGGEPHLHSHEGHQWLYVLDGRVRLLVEDDERTLARGDAVEFDTWRPHWLAAIDHPAQALAIFSPRGQPLRPASPGGGRG
jgi:transcriptional regulator with XRE-family HTH domain